VSIDLTVVIPTYNRRELLNGAVQSLREQTYPADRYEIIIVSDGCTDGTDEQYGTSQARFIDAESAFSWQASFKVSALREIDGYDDPFRRYGWEDVDVAFRASLRGMRFFYEPDPLSYRRDTLRAHGQRLREASRHAPFLFARNPELRNRIPMYVDKEPIDWPRDSARLIASKASRALLANRTVHSALVALTPAMEPVLSASLLRRWYHAVLGGYVFKGYREGLAEAAIARDRGAAGGGSDSRG
jgi:GT2 family glycosyltransferase